MKYLGAQLPLLTLIFDLRPERSEKNSGSIQPFR
jgi:hypothetical protein